MESVPRERPSTQQLSRRAMLRWSSTAALTAWAVPTVVTWKPSPAHAGTPLPLEEVRAGEEKVRAGEAEVRAGDEEVRAGDEEVRAGDEEVATRGRPATPTVAAAPVTADDPQLAVTGRNLLALTAAGAAAAAGGAIAVKRAGSAFGTRATATSPPAENHPLSLPTPPSSAQ